MESATEDNIYRIRKEERKSKKTFFAEKVWSSHICSYGISRHVLSNTRATKLCMNTEHLKCG